MASLLTPFRAGWKRESLSTKFKRFRVDYSCHLLGCITWHFTGGHSRFRSNNNFVNTKVNNKAERRRKSMCSERYFIKFSTIEQHNRMAKDKGPALLPNELVFAPTERTIDYIFCVTYISQRQSDPRTKNEFSTTVHRDERDGETHKHTLNLNGYEQLHDTKLSELNCFLLFLCELLNARPEFKKSIWKQWA